MNATRVMLGIESSCDETAAAVVRGDGTILSSVIHDQTDLHSVYGGVVPEIAARAHVDKLDGTIAEALRAGGVPLSAIDAIAVTAGPGLIGGLMAGVLTAQGMALGTGKPLYGINHLEGHVLTARLTDGVAFPYLTLLVSGGHCLLLLTDGPGAHTRLGGTIDDAPGEAFDKVAKLLGLGYPGGPAVERTARGGDAARLPLPRPLLGRPGCDFSFSGLKTALRQTAEMLAAEPGGITAQDAADLCAAFQAAVAETLARQSAKAMALFREARPDAEPVIAVSGGVAANGAVRAALGGAAAKEGFSVVAPPLSLCGDNAAMIAWAGLEHGAANLPPGPVMPRPRWPLDADAAPLVGSGRRGPKS